MANKENENHFAYKVGKQTLTMLMSYRNPGLSTRTFMLQEHANMLEQVRTKKDKYEKYKEKDLNFIESLVYIELIERFCLLIEDFTTLCYALLGDLSEFPSKFVNAPEPIKVLKELNNAEKWFVLLRYPNADALDFSTEEKQFIKEHYRRNIDVLLKFVQIIKDFYERHKLFHVKRKHANPLIFGLEKMEIAGEPTFMIPYVYDSKKPENIRTMPLRHSVYQKNQTLFNNLYRLMDNIIKRTISFIERNGSYILEDRSFYNIKKEDHNRLQKFIDRYDTGITHRKVEVKFKLTAKPDQLRSYLKLYDSFDTGAFDKY